MTTMEKCMIDTDSDQSSDSGSAATLMTGSGSK